MSEQKDRRFFQSIVVAAQSSAHALLLEAASRCLARHSDRAVVEVIHIDSTGRDQQPIDQLLAAVSDFSADLLVMGARSHTLASRIAMMAPCSVLMVPDGVELSPDHVIVPVDFSSHSAAALRLASALVESGSVARLSVLAVECDDEPRICPDENNTAKDRALRDFIRAARYGDFATRRLIEPIQRSAALLHHPGLSLPHAIEGADTAATIVLIAEREGANLIVMGTRGRSRSASVLLGSVTEKVIQFARCPVLAVKQAGEHLGLLETILERVRKSNPVHTN